MPPQRLQNPKLEKAEILDLAVKYIKKTTRKTETKGKVFTTFTFYFTHLNLVLNVQYVTIFFFKIIKM